MPHLYKIDHVTYACAKGMLKKWAWFHIEIEGGTLITRIDDVRPDDLRSSMKLWCIGYGNFGVALVEGIDRNEKSQVTYFVEKHGDHACQHVAYDCYNVIEFRKHLERMGVQLRGGTIVRSDGFGVLKQMFAKGYAEGNAAEATFPEYVQRPRSSNDFSNSEEITFSHKSGLGFYEQIELSFKNHDSKPLIDFSLMLMDWQVPSPES